MERTKCSVCGNYFLTNINIKNCHECEVQELAKIEEVQKWEYEFMYWKCINYLVLQKKLKEKGDSGWKICGTTEEIIFFKRKKS